MMDPASEFNESERPYDQRRSVRSVCVTERRSLFRTVHVGTNIGTSAEYLSKNAERGQ